MHTIEGISTFSLYLAGTFYAQTQAHPTGVVSQGHQSPCRCFPGDTCWPSAEVWDKFNATIGGRLISTIPIAAVCHTTEFAVYNPTACDTLQSEWYLPETHIQSSSSVMAPLFTNNSCNPFLPSNTPCSRGNYARYAVNATGAEDYRKTLQFVREHNIRLVIRNTGHDYNGKSTGAGSLSLWTNHLKSKEMVAFNSSSYSGKAFKFGAGVLAIEAYEFADLNGHTVVGPNLPSVGLIGGYSQGGGHGPLASRYGLAADQVLAWELVLASGEVITASPDEPKYSDLFWALSGGGGGTFGAVLSATVKAHPEMGMSTANLTFSAPENSTEEFWESIEIFTKHVPAINNANAAAIWYVQGLTFSLATLWGPGFSKKDLDNLVQPFLDNLDTLKLAYTYSSEQHASFLEGFTSQAPVSVGILGIGGRLIPASAIEKNSTALTTAIRRVTESGALFSGVSFNVSGPPEDSVSANPYWRESVFDAVLGLPFNYTHWERNYEDANLMTEELLPQFEELTPDGAAYLNEADFQQPDWEVTFYGSNWDRLSQIKSKYDPADVFYALGAVGSERWTQQMDARLCHV